MKTSLLTFESVREYAQTVGATLVGNGGEGFSLSYGCYTVILKDLDEVVAYISKHQKTQKIEGM